MIYINIKLIEEIIEYIEGTCEQLDAEYGANRNFDELQQDDYHNIIPDFYYELKKLIRGDVIE